VRGEAVHKCKGVGKRFNGATWLARTEGDVDLSVVGGVEKIPRADHREDGATFRVDNETSSIVDVEGGEARKFLRDLLFKQ